MQVISQRNYDDCAIACCMMLLLQYGIDLSYQQVEQEFRCQKNPRSIGAIQRVLSHFGVESNVGYCNEKEMTLSTLTTPILLHYHQRNFHHFVILFKIGEQICDVGDPRFFRIHRLKTKRLLQLWSGYLLFIPQKPHPIQQHKKYWYYSYQIRLILYLLVLVGVVLAYFIFFGLVK